MIDTAKIFNKLLNLNVKFFAGVPDSLLKDFCAYISDNVNSKEHVITANEGAAVALGIGYHIATNKIPLIYMQNSGLGNAINPLLSLADPDVYSIPMLVMIGWRGEPEVKDEPQHIKQGKVTIPMLEAMGITYFMLKRNASQDEAETIIEKAHAQAQESKSPVAIVVQKEVFSRYQINNPVINTNQLERHFVIKNVISSINKNDIVVATTGFTSRELFELREVASDGHSMDFLTVGGMGHASQIALGISLFKKDRNVFCLDGDGAFLMHLGSSVINSAVGGVNFKHILINNEAHESVGGQPTLTHNVDFTKLAESIGYENIYHVKNELGLSDSIASIISDNGPSIMIVNTKLGFDKSMGRPTTTPKQNKEDLMTFINAND